MVAALILLLGLLLLSLQAYTQDQNINTASLPVDVSFTSSLGRQGEIGSRKLLVGGQGQVHALTEKKVGSSSSEDAKRGEDELTGASLKHGGQGKGKSLAANEMNNSLHIPPQMFGKPNFNVDYSGPQTHGPKHH